MKNCKFLNDDFTMNRGKYIHKSIHKVPNFYKKYMIEKWDLSEYEIELLNLNTNDSEIEGGIDLFDELTFKIIK